MSQQKVILLLGSNLGDRKKNIALSLKKIEEGECKILKKTEVLKTNPIEFVSCNIFCNIAVSIETCFSPIRLLKFIKKIEAEMGRSVDSVGTGKYTDRTIDIDIVLYGNVYFHSAKLNIPHKKHLYERNFSIDLIRQVEFNSKS